MAELLEEEKSCFQSVVGDFEDLEAKYQAIRQSHKVVEQLMEERMEEEILGTTGSSSNLLPESRSGSPVSPVYNPSSPMAVLDHFVPESPIYEPSVSSISDDEPSTSAHSGAGSRSWAAVTAAKLPLPTTTAVAVAVVPPNVPPLTVRTNKISPRGLATIRSVSREYGMLAMHSGGVIVAFTKETTLNSGTLHVDALSEVFRCGDVVSVDGASRFRPLHCPNVPFHARRMSWVMAGSGRAVTYVGHGVMLSRFPEPVFGIQEFHHVDAPARSFAGVHPADFAICRTALLRYKTEPLADHGHEAVNVAPVDPVRYEEEVVFILKLEEKAMLAVATSGDVVFVPRNVLIFRKLRPARALLGEAMPALTCPILPYENPGAVAPGRQAPSQRAFLLFPSLAQAQKCAEGLS